MARPLAQEMRVQGSLTGELQNLIYDLLPTLEELEAKYVDLVGQTAKLKAAGLIYATEWWRPDGNGAPRYLYLLYPQQPGQPRRRDYVGADDDKIQEARESIARAKQFDTLTAEAQQIREKIENAAEFLDQGCAVLKGKPRFMLRRRP